MEKTQKILLKSLIAIDDGLQRYFPPIISKYRQINISINTTRLGIYADGLLEDIETALRNTVNSVSTILQQESYNTTLLYSYKKSDIYEEYTDYIFNIDQIYVDMFNSFTTDSRALFKKQEKYKANLNKPYGFVTNSISTLFLYELTQAVIDASKEAKVYGKALNDYQTRQRSYLDKISSLWRANYDRCIIDGISSYNNLFKSMLLNICCEIINTDGQSFEQIFKGLNLEEQKKILINEETQDKQQEIRSILKKTIEKSDAVEEQLKALKFSFLGEKGRMRRNLIKLSDRIYLAKSSNRYSLDGRIETIYIEKTWDEKTVPNFVIAIDFRESDFKYIAHIQGLKSIIGELNNQFLSAAGGYRSFVATMLGGSSDFTTLQIQIIHEIKWTSFYD